MATDPQVADSASVDLYWLPLGAGDAHPSVRRSGRLFEALVAHHEHRGRRDLYHSALEVQLDGDRFVIEMAPVWSNAAPEIAVVCEGSVGLSWLRRSRFFRYEVHCCRDGMIADRAEAVASPRRLSSDSGRARQVLALVPEFPNATWGRDELGTGEMWNSNSLTAWLLARSGHDIESVDPPRDGRAPGWSAGLSVAMRQITARAHDPKRPTG
jgi:hypothetical protein